MTLEQLFDKHGNCPTMGDPYRNSNPTTDLLFDEYGDVLPTALAFLRRLVQERKVKPMCDAITILMADRFACNTKCNYNAITMWR